MITNKEQAKAIRVTTAHKTTTAKIKAGATAEQIEALRNTFYSDPEVKTVEVLYA